jgi:tetratricopeptide (TPR) repeat protein
MVTKKLAKGNVVRKKVVVEHDALVLKHQTLPVINADVAWNRLVSDPSNIGVRANLIRLQLNLNYLKKVVRKDQLPKCDIDVYVNYLKQRLVRYTGPKDAARLLLDINRKLLGSLDSDTIDSIRETVEHMATKPIEEQMEYVVRLILEKFADETHTMYEDLLSKRSKSHQSLDQNLGGYEYRDLSIAAGFNIVERQYYGAIDLLNAALKKAPNLESEMWTLQRLSICYFQMNDEISLKKVLRTILIKDPRLKHIDLQELKEAGIDLNKMLGR